MKNPITGKTEINDAALKLYDRLNPHWDKIINVSKDDCIRIVTGRLPRGRWALNWLTPIPR